MKNQHHIHMTKGLFLIGVIGVLVVNSAKSMAMISEERKDVIQGQEEIGQLIIKGEVTRVQGEFVGKDFSQMKDRRYVVETPFGRAWDLHLGDETQKIGDIFLGDHVKASIGKDGSLQTVQKIEKKNTNSNNSVVRRRITGRVERMDGNFLFVKQGERTEILHLNDQSTLEGDIHEGSTIVAQLGEAGYAIKIQEFRNEPGTNSK